MTLARTRSSKSRALNLAFCLGMAALCGGFLLAGSKWLRAEHHRDTAVNLIAKWKASQTVPLDEWNTAQDAMEQAVALHDSRANLHYFVGYLHELRLAAPNSVDESLPPQAQQLAQYQAAAAELRRAGIAYRSSLERGPSLPDTWSRLAFVMQSLGLFDRDFIAAYGNTWRYGRNVSGLHPALTDLSLRFYAQIRANETVAPIQAAHLQNVLGRRNARQHMELVARYGLVSEVCKLAMDSGWTLDAYAVRTCSTAIGAGNTL